MGGSYFLYAQPSGDHIDIFQGDVFPDVRNIIPLLVNCPKTFYEPTLWK